MICAQFLYRSGVLCGFDIRGHSGFAGEGSDIVCAAVSSAAYLTANTVTDVCGCPAQITESDGVMRLELAAPDCGRVQDHLCGLQQHLQGMAAQYPRYIRVQQTEV